VCSRDDEGKILEIRWNVSGDSDWQRTSAFFACHRGELVAALKSDVVKVGSRDVQWRSPFHRSRHSSSCGCWWNHHSHRLLWRKQASESHHVAHPCNWVSIHCWYPRHLQFHVLDSSTKSSCVQLPVLQLKLSLHQDVQVDDRESF